VPSGTGNGGLRNYLPDGETVPFQPWAEELYKQRVANNGVGLPSEHCLPHGLPGAMMIPIGFQIMQTPEQIAVLFEEFNYYRRIMMDGRGLPDVMFPTWFGYSVGRWDKDTLVVDTIGFNDRTWIDNQRLSAHRGIAYHGALYAAGLWPHGPYGYDRRSEGVHEAMDSDASLSATRRP